jgi:hypothetical protein
MLPRTANERNSSVGLPLHRWLTFADSWPAASVEHLLGAAQVDSTDVIYDPFVGCGTTAVVSAQRSMRTFSADVSPLAIAATRIKLAPPCEQELDRFERMVHRLTPERLLKSFANRTLPETVSGTGLGLIQFVLAAVLMRLGWHEGNALSMDDVSAEIARLINEMHADSAARFDPPQPHRVLCSEFLAIDRADLTAFAEGRLVLISSPPFFGSNSNPALQRLAGLFDEPIRKATSVKRPPAWSVAEALPILEPLRGAGESYDEVADYLFFLDRIVAHAVDTRCRAVAIEMGPKNIGGCEVRFDLFLAERLLANNYRIDLFETAETEPEICTFICATANGSSGGAIQ